MEVQPFAIDVEVLSNSVWLYIILISPAASPVSFSKSLILGILGSMEFPRHRPVPSQVYVGFVCLDRKPKKPDNR